MHHDFRTEARASLALAKMHDLNFTDDYITIQSYSNCIHQNKTHTFFSNFSYDTPQDSQYRALARRFLEQANIHLNNGLHSEATEILQEALNIQRNIQEMNDNDAFNICDIEERIKTLVKIQEPTDSNNSMLFDHQSSQMNQTFYPHHTIFKPQPVRINTNNLADWEEYLSSNMNVESKSRRL